VKTRPSLSLKQTATSITSPGLYVFSNSCARVGLSVKCCAGIVPLPKLPEQRQQKQKWYIHNNENETMTTDTSTH
jgi:hypothetical protein